MHIVFDARIHLNHITGISRYIINLLDNVFQIDKKNNYTILINDTIKENDILIEKFKVYSNVTIKRIALPHFGPVNYLKMPKIVQSLGADIYHYPHIDAPIVKGIPTISTIHDFNNKNGVKKYDDTFGLKTLYFKMSLKNTLKKSSKIIFVSESVKQDAIAKYPSIDSSKFYVIYNAIESNFNDITNQQLKETAKRLNLPKNYFLFVGQFREHKNISRIIQAFNKLKNSNYELILIGYKYNNDISIEYPNIRHIGMVSDQELKCCYALCSCFVFPSLIEGFGIPIIEAMEMGAPVITSNFGATLEIAKNAAILVNPYSVEEISEKMQLFIDENINREDIIKKGKLNARNFSWEISAKQMVEVYDSYSLKQL